MRVFHAGYDEIRDPDIRRGRVNADFGQGFYTTDNEEFARRWVLEKPGADVFVNIYELDETGLKVKRFERDGEWFRYVFSNRRSMPDKLSEYDVIVGPIANDTIFNTMGIMTSGYLTDDEAVQLLTIGPLYSQVVIKSDKAREALRFVSAETLPHEVIQENKKILSADEEKYMAEFASVMEQIQGE